MNKFSFITPVYGESYKSLGACYEALKEQNHQKWEWIIVLDGANEKAEKAILKGFDLERGGKKVHYELLSDKRVNYYITEHGGAPKARNFGASKATGDFLSFLDPDTFLFNGTIKDWLERFTDYPEMDFIYGNFEYIGGGMVLAIDFSRTLLESNNYISGTFPMRRKVFPGWDESLKALQDWDLWLTITKKSKGMYINKSYFITEPAGRDSKSGGISQYSYYHWKDLRDKIRNKHGIKKSDIAIVSLGAPFHAISTAKILGAECPIQSIDKPHSYKTIYLLGFYPASTKIHMSIFYHYAVLDQKHEFKGNKIIHWIGSDIMDLRNLVSFNAMKSLKNAFNKLGFIHLTECKATHDELAEVGIESKIVPLPPERLFQYEEYPLPKKFTVANYVNKGRDIYYENFMTDVAKSMPDVRFVFYGDKDKFYKDGNIEYVGWQPIEEIVKRSSCLTRIMLHDGLPLAPLQFLTAGRRVVGNYDFKGFDVVRIDKKSVIHKLREIQSSPKLDKKYSDYWLKELDHNLFKRRIKRIIK